MNLRTVTATRYVTPLREGGSLPAIVEADDDGLYVLKFRGAGQGPKALLAEIVAGGPAPPARRALARHVFALHQPPPRAAEHRPGHPEAGGHGRRRDRRNAHITSSYSFL